MDLEPPKYELMNENDTKERLKLFKGERTGWVFVGPKRYFFPYKYIEEGNGYFNFKARTSDTWVLSFPRSGTTLTQELVWLLCNDLDFKKAKTEYLAERFPFLEFSMFNHPEVTEEFLKMNEDDKEKKEICKKIAEPGYKFITKIPSTQKRFIKSHFPFSLLPNILKSDSKIVYVARNPKDVAVSWFYLNVAFKTLGYVGDFATFLEYFLKDETPWSPYFEHLKEAWAYRNHPNVLFIFYEEMQSDFIKAIKKVAKFLGKSYTDKEIEELANFLNINNFRNNPMVNSSELKNCGIIASGQFIRKGGCGGWKQIFTKEMNEKMNKWIKENLKGTDLAFPYLDIDD